MGRVRTFSGVQVDQDARRVRADGVDVELTRSEFELLTTLMDRPGVAISNRELLEVMWDSEWRIDTTPLQVHVSRLRHKLGESGSRQRHIVTVRGFGYRFEPEPPSVVSEVSEDRKNGEDGDERHGVTVEYDCDLVVRSISPPIAVLDWSPEEIVGRYFSPMRRERAEALAFVHCLSEMAMSEFQCRFAATTKDGSIVPVLASVVIRSDDQGEFDGLVAHWTFLTS